MLYKLIGMSVLCSNFLKYADRIKTKYAAKVYGIMPRSHVRIKLTLSTYGLEMEKVTVYAEKYAIYTLLGNMRIMPRLHIRINQHA